MTAPQPVVLGLYTGRSIDEWRSWWHPEFEALGLPRLEPHQLPEYAQKQRRRWLLTDAAANEAFDAADSVLEACRRAVTPKVWTWLADYRARVTEADRQADVLRCLMQAELDYLRPLVGAPVPKSV